jgi:hypothetical protein
VPLRSCCYSEHLLTIGVCCLLADLDLLKVMKQHLNASDDMDEKFQRVLKTSLPQYKVRCKLLPSFLPESCLRVCDS